MADQSERQEEQRGGDGDQHVHRHSRQRDDDVAASVVSEIGRVDRAWLCAANRDASEAHENQGHDDRAVQIDVHDRIERQSPRIVGRRITLLECRIGMPPLVRDEREQEDGNGLENRYERALIQCDAWGPEWAGGGASALKVAET